MAEKRGCFPLHGVANPRAGRVVATPRILIGRPPFHIIVEEQILRCVAKDLIDTIDVKLKPTITTLNATQTQRYFQILQEFTAGQSLQSLSDINRFVTENPGVENNSQVKELLRRIRAVTTNGT